jgi:hypothetical protein
MSKSKKDLPVRRLLQLGAASAGMGAALVGWSLLGSEVGVASADSGVTSSSSAGPASSSSSSASSGGVGKDRPASSTSGRAEPDSSQDDAEPRSTTSRRANRTSATEDAPASPAGASRSNRVAKAEDAAAERAANATVVNTRVASDAAAPNRDTAGSTSSTATPSVTTDREENQILQDPGTQFLGGGGAGTPPVVTAGVRDGLGAIGKFLAQVGKEAFSSRPLLNSLQGLGPNLPGLLDLIPKTRYQVDDPLGRLVKQAKDAEAARNQDAKTRQINEIIAKGTKLTASDGYPVYTIDGENFVRYERVSFSVYGDKVTEHPRQPRLVTLRPGPYLDRHISTLLKVDPAQVRNLSVRR